MGQSQAYSKVEKHKEVVFMTRGQGGGNNFALIVVLFILLIIVGASFMGGLY